MIRTGLPRIAAFLLAFVTAAASAGGIPRLWEVKESGPGATGRFYILAVTHNALDTEYDDYLAQIVIPVAMKADVFFREASGMVPNAYPPCPTPLADTEENRQILRTVRHEVERAGVDFFRGAQWVPDLSAQEAAEVEEALRTMAHDKAAELSEYGLIAQMTSYFDNTLARHPELWPNWLKPRPQVADYLAEQRIRKKIKANESIDANLDIFHAYCGVSSARRAHYLLRLVTENDPAKFKSVTKQDRARFDADFTESLQRGFLVGTLADAASDEYKTHLVCDRNDKWMATMRRAPGSGIHFYALGVAHVLQPGPDSPSRCDGLLARLRQEGFSVTLLK
jgi:uncharacterized protein YbaP (TraB family)